MPNKPISNDTCSIKMPPYSSHQTIGYQLNKILRLKRRFIDHEMQQLNLSRTQWLTLVWIQLLGPSCPQKDLLVHLEIDAGHLTRVLAELEDRKYISRTIINENRRCLLIEVTPYYIKDISPVIAEILEKENYICVEHFPFKY